MRATLLTAALALSAPAAADVTIERRYRSSGFKGFGAYEAESTRHIQGKKSLEESTTRFTGKVLKLASGKKGRQAVSIVRVDLDKRWELDPKKKTYVESPISVEPAPEEPAAEKPGAPREESKPTHRVKRTSFEAKRTGEKKEVNGFPAERFAGALTVEVEDLETKETGEFRLVTDTWTTPWTAALRKAAKEEREFAAAYAKKLSEKLTPDQRRMFSPEAVQAMLGASGEDTRKTLAKFQKELEKIEGFPVVVESAWHAPASKARAEGKAADEDEGVGVDDLSGGAAGIATGILGRMAKKKAKQKMEERAQAAAGKPALSTYTEVVAVKTEALPKERFELPEGYKKRG